MRSLISIPLLLLCGCTDIGYYWHNASGHLGVMNQRVEIETLLDDDRTDEKLRKRLLLVQEIRLFSVEQLDLPDNDSYNSYVQLEHPYVVQNLFAAPEFSTRLKQWCYPVIGCASYRGYYDETRLQAYSETLKAEGFEIYIGRVPAYSTLGWFDDPVLSSFINWTDYRLAGLIFHELTHQRIYIDDDTTFNESLASAVQQVGTQLWLQAKKRNDDAEMFSRWLLYRAEVIELIIETRRQLSRVYADDLSDEQKRTAKMEHFQAAREQHTIIASEYGVKRGFTNWFAAELNNARIGSIAAYNTRVQAFINMLSARQNNFSEFYDYVDRIADLDRETRDHCLDDWEQDSAENSDSCPVEDPDFTGDA